MQLTKDFKETIQARAVRDPEFRIGLLQTGRECLISGDLETGKTLLRDYIIATFRFEELAALTNQSSNE